MMEQKTYQENKQKLLHNATFRPSKKRESWFEHGYHWFVMSFAAEMINSLLSLWLQDIDQNHLDAIPKYEACILWRIKNKKEISGETLFNFFKTVHTDFIAHNLSRSSRQCDPSEDFEWIQLSNDSDYKVCIPYKESKHASLNYECMKSLVTTTPRLNKDLYIYLKNFNCPGLVLFLQILRCNHKLALRSLLARVQESEALKSKFDAFMQEFPVVVQSEIMYALEYAQQDSSIFQATPVELTSKPSSYKIKLPTENLNNPFLELRQLYQDAYFKTRDNGAINYKTLTAGFVEYSALWMRITALFRVCQNVQQVQTQDVQCYLLYDNLNLQNVQALEQTLTPDFNEEQCRQMLNSWMMKCFDTPGNDQRLRNLGLISCRALYFAHQNNIKNWRNFLTHCLEKRTKLVISACVHAESHLPFILPTTGTEYYAYETPITNQLYNFGYRSLLNVGRNGKVLAQCKGGINIKCHGTRMSYQSQQRTTALSMTDEVLYILHANAQNNLQINVHTCAGMFLFQITPQRVNQNGVLERFPHDANKSWIITASLFDKNIVYLARCCGNTIYQINLQDYQTPQYKAVGKLENVKILDMCCSNSSKFLYVLSFDTDQTINLWRVHRGPKNYSCDKYKLNYTLSEQWNSNFLVEWQAQQTQHLVKFIALTVEYFDTLLTITFNKDKSVRYYNLRYEYIPERRNLDAIVTNDKVRKICHLQSSTQYDQDENVVRTQSSRTRIEANHYVYKLELLCCKLDNGQLNFVSKQFEYSTKTNETDNTISKKYTVLSSDDHTIDNKALFFVCGKDLLYWNGAETTWVANRMHRGLCYVNKTCTMYTQLSQQHRRQKEREGIDNYSNFFFAYDSTNNMTYKQ